MDDKKGIKVMTTTKEQLKTTNFKDWKKCNRKKRYYTQKSAMSYIKSKKKAGVIISNNLVIYRCSICGDFHIGHSRRRINSNGDRRKSHI